MRELVVDRALIKVHRVDRDPNPADGYTKALELTPFKTWCDDLIHLATK